MKHLIRTALTLLPFLYMGFIWFLSSNPSDMVVELPDSAVDRFIKEALHLVEFAILYMLFAAALASWGALTPALSLAAAAAAALYGITDEIHQYFVPSRSASWIDVLKDAIGVAAAYFHVRYHYFSRSHGLLMRLGTFLNK